MRGIRARVCRVFALAVIFVWSAAPVFADPTVGLTVLNQPSPSGDTIIVQGDPVEVEFQVEDLLGETSGNDVIRLVRLSDAAIISQKNRGNLLAGTLVLGTSKSQVLGEAEVQYVLRSTGAIAATAPITVFLVENQAVAELSDRTASVETAAADALAAAQAAQATANAAKADAIQAKTDAVAAIQEAQQAQATASAAAQAA